MCGEHVAHAVVNRQAEGSSPHVRGAHRGMLPRSVETGIIPACAGSTKCF